MRIEDNVHAYDHMVFLVLIYSVHVHTAKTSSGAGIHSNAFMNIFGSQGYTGHKHLMFSKT